MLGLTFLVLLFFAAGAVVIVLYNSLVAKRNMYKNAFAQIDVQLQRRFDLVPNLVDSMRAYMKHESETLQNVIAARNGALSALQDAKRASNSPQSLKKLSQSNQHLNSVLHQLGVVVESYPELKANQNMLHLQEELVSTENKVAFSRQAYNDAVMDYNTSLERFPQNILAEIFGFKPATSFQVDVNSPTKEPIHIQF